MKRYIARALRQMAETHQFSQQKAKRLYRALSQAERRDYAAAWRETEWVGRLRR